jgi:hypothetical protein
LAADTFVRIFSSIFDKLTSTELHEVLIPLPVQIPHYMYLPGCDSGSGVNSQYSRDTHGRPGKDTRCGIYMHVCKRTCTDTPPVRCNGLPDRRESEYMCRQRPVYFLVRLSRCACVRARVCVCLFVRVSVHACVCLCGVAGGRSGGWGRGRPSQHGMPSRQACYAANYMYITTCMYSWCT